MGGSEKKGLSLECDRMPSWWGGEQGSAQAPAGRVGSWLTVGALVGRLLDGSRGYSYLSPQEPGKGPLTHSPPPLLQTKRISRGPL